MTSRNEHFSELIPDYVHQQLDAETQAAFEHALQSDPQLRQELSEFLDFQKLYSQSETEPLPSADRVFAKITENISTLEHEATSRSAPSEQRPISGYLTQLVDWMRESVGVPWALAAVQAAVIVLLLIPAAPEKTPYQTLSEPSQTVGHDRTTVNVVFNPQAQEGAIRQLLIQINGTLSGGPSSQGRYLVAFDTSTDMEGVITILKQSDLVIFAELTN